MAGPAKWPVVRETIEALIEGRPVGTDDVPEFSDISKQYD